VRAALPRSVMDPPYLRLAAERVNGGRA
jgi:hypothetical protein